jgi:hypothetical protein
MRRGLKQRPHLFVGSLRKFLVPHAHRFERLGRAHTHYLIRLRSKTLESFHRCYWRCHYNPPGVHLSQRSHSRPHCGSGGQSIVHYDYGAVRKAGEGNVASIRDLLPLNFLLFLGSDGVDHRSGYPKRGNYVSIQNANASDRNSAHCQFALAGYAQLSHHENVQWRPQRSCHFIGHRHPTAGQAEHDHSRIVCITR